MAEPARVLPLAVMNFVDDLRAAAEAPDAACWNFEPRGELEVWLTVSPTEHPADRYVARLLWRDYPGELPPSVKFVDLGTGRIDIPKAWPKANGFRPGSLDICANWTAEGFALHPEWASTEHRWQPAGNVILKVAHILQTELDTSYAGHFNG